MMPCDCEYDYVSHNAMCSASCLPVVDLLMSLGMGKKERFRNLKDLYDTSQQLQPTQPFNFGMKETSIACSHRITRCSLDAYFHRVPAISSVGIGHFTNKTPKEKRVSRCPSNDGVLVFPSLSSAGDCRQHTSSKGDHFEYSSEQVESTRARAPISGLDSWLDGIYSYATFWGGDTHLNCFKIETHLPHKNHLLESIAVIKNTNMQESQQLQLGNQRDVSDLMDDEVRVCDTCGSVGLDSKLIVCHKCHDGAEHIYCMRVDEMSELTANKELRKDWICQECMLREGTNKLVQDEVEVAASRKKGHLSESSTNCESSKGSKLKSRSSCPGTSGEIGAQLSVKRDRVSIKKLKIKSVNEIVYSVPERSSGETLFSGPSFCNIEAVESSGQLDYRLQASNHNTHEDPNYSNGKMKNESQQGEQPTKAATARSMYQLCTDLAYDERTHLRDLVQVEAAILSERVIVPEANHTWLGKFQIHSNEGIGRTWDGIQAHLSNCTSHKVLEVVDRLPKIIILEELPRLRIWPPQFMGSQVTEENIALYFFAHEQDSYRCYEQLVDYMIEHDLALKGNLDGVELLIFPSTILPEKSWRWNQMLFIWGVFRGRKVNNSTTTPTLNSLKLGNGDAAKSLPFDLNAYPQDGDDMAIVDKIPEFDSGPSGDRVLVVGENSNSKGGEANAERADAIIDVNVSLWPESETPENGSIGIEDSSVEAPSTSLSLAPPLDPTDWKLVDALIFLSKS